MKTITLLTLFICALSINAQNSQFSLKNALPQSANPALIGTSQEGRLNVGIRLRDPGNFYYSIVNVLSYDQHVAPLHGGLGAQISYDRWGDNIQSSTGASLGYAYQLSIGENLTLSAGTSGKWRRRLRTSPVSQPEWTPKDEITNYCDLSGGFLLYSKNFFVGGQYTHTRSLINSKLYKNNSFHYISTQLGYLLTPFTNDDLSVSLTANYENYQKYQRLGFSGVFNARYFSVGASYDFRNETSLIAGLNIKSFEFKYALSMVFSDLVPNKYYASELILRVKLPNKPSRSTNSLDMPLY